MPNPKPWYEYLLEYLAGASTEQTLKKSGATPLGTFSMPLGSGYNRAADINARIEALRTLCQRLITDPRYIAHDITGDGRPETFCNFAAAEAANAYGCHDLDGLNADMQLLRLQGQPFGWTIGTGTRAAAHALLGGLAFAAKSYPGEHGHITLIAPEPPEMSGSWGIMVPIVAHVGKPPNAIKKVSGAFPVAKGEPQYFLYKDGEA